MHGQQNIKKKDTSYLLHKYTTIKAKTCSYKIYSF